MGAKRPCQLRPLADKEALNQRIFLRWNLDATETVHKTIGVYKENEYGFIPACRATYDNENNETCIKEVEKRDWLYPLKEKVSAE